MPTYRSLLQRVENLRRSVAASPPTTEAVAQLSLLLQMAQLEADAHPLAASHSLCARARANAEQAQRLIDSSLVLLHRAGARVERPVGRGLED